jgi:hypothetical protein
LLSELFCTPLSLLVLLYCKFISIIIVRKWPPFDYSVCAVISKYRGPTQTILLAGKCYGFTL